MKAVAERDALLTALDRVTRIAKPGPNAFMETLLLGVTADGLTLSGTDFDIEAEVKCAAEVAELGKATVPAEAFGKLIKRLPAGAITLKAISDPPRVLVTAKRSKVNLPSLDPSDHVRFGVHEATHHFSVPGVTLASMLRDVAFAAPDDESYGGNVFGVCLHHDPETDRLTAVATNTRKLARRTAAAPEGSASMPRVLLGMKATDEIAKLCEAAGSAEVEVALSARMIEVCGADTLLRSKLIEQVFPPYERILPQTVGARLTVEGDALKQVLSRAELVALDKGRGVRIDLADGLATVSVASENGAGIIDEIEGEYEAGTDTLFLSGLYAQEFLKVIDSGVVHVEVGRERKHTVWRRPGDDGLLCFLMPRVA